MEYSTTNFSTSKVQANEIVKADDFEFGFKSIAENMGKLTRMILESNKDIVIGGKVVPAGGTTVKIEPIFGVSYEDGTPFGNIDYSPIEAGGSVGSVSVPPDSVNNGVYIIQVRGTWEDYDEQQRAFNDLDNNTITYQNTNTKQRLSVECNAKFAVGDTAPDTDAGWVKIAEVKVNSSAAEITEADIYNITADTPTEENKNWSNEKDRVYNAGKLTDVNNKFRVEHTPEGKHKDGIIGINNINKNSVTGASLNIGKSINIEGENTLITDIIASVVEKLAVAINRLHEKYEKFGDYGFKGEISLSNIADEKNLLTKALKISADGEGNAYIKLADKIILTMTADTLIVGDDYNTNYNSDNLLVTKKITKELQSQINILRLAVEDLISAGDPSYVANKALSPETFDLDNTEIRCATTDNVELSGDNQNIDGVIVAANDIVLVKNQTDATANGLYLVSNTNWTRLNGYNTGPNQLSHKLYVVRTGITNGGRIFYLPKVNFTSSSFGTDALDVLEYIGAMQNKPKRMVMRDKDGNIAANKATMNLLGNVQGNSSGNHTGTINGMIPGSSLSKEVGKESENVPVIGSALPTIANYPILTDSEGKLKPGTSPIDAAAYKAVADTFASSNGDKLPTVNTVKNNTYGVVINSVPTNGNITLNRNITLETGAILKVLFTAPYYSNLKSSNYPTINNIPIMVYQYKDKILKLVNLPVHRVNVSQEYVNYYWWWQEGTTMELMYNGSAWVVINNPNVLSCSSDTVSYTVKADGLIEQWGCNTSRFCDTSKVVKLAVEMITDYYYVTFTGCKTSKSNYPLILYKRINKTFDSFSIITTGDYDNGFDWIIKGY